MDITTEFKNSNNLENTKLLDEKFQFNCFFVKNTTYAHWHKHLEIIYCLSGSITVQINNQSYICNQGDIIFVPKNSLHSIEPIENANYCAILIGNNFLKFIVFDYYYENNIFDFINNDHISSIIISNNLQYYDYFKQIVESIINEFNNKLDSYKIVVIHQISLFLINLSRYTILEKEVFNYEKFQDIENIKKVIEFVHKNYQDKILVSEMAKITNFSVQHFCRLFKFYTGKTLIEYINFVRIEKAKKLIIETDLTITQISETTGFCNPNYFQRVFKNKVYRTPLSLRKKDHHVFYTH